MASYILRRLIQSVLILLGVSFITFVLLFVLPADPVRQIAGRAASAATVENIRQQLGLDQPFVVQYGRYLWNLAHGDLGRSYLQKTDVATLIWSRLPATLLLMAAGIAAELLIGLTLGVIAALWKGRALDQGLMVGGFVAVSAPQFVVGLLLLYVFAVRLGWFPIGGYGTAAHLVLPALTLGILGSGWYSRMMRSSMIEVLRADYIRTARAKGLSEHKVIYHHAFRNTLIPLVTFIGGSLPGLFAGALITETLFAIPGIGFISYNAMVAGDIPFSMFYMTFLAILTLLGNLISDILYAVVDPRVRIA